MDSPITLHHDPTRPAFGYVPDPKHGYGDASRAADARGRAARLCDNRAGHIAERVAYGLSVDPVELRRYLEAKAGERYADAVAEVEYAKAMGR